MDYFRKDGELDVEGINQLPLDKYMDVIGNLTREQYQYYCSKSPICEGHQQTKVVDFLPLDEVIERGIGVDADCFLNNLREELNKK